MGQSHFSTAPGPSRCCCGACPQSKGKHGPATSRHSILLPPAPQAAQYVMQPEGFNLALEINSLFWFGCGFWFFFFFK